MRRIRTISLVCLVALLSGLPGAARATHETTGTYELPAIAQWSKSHLTVLIVPPNHGQIFNEPGGILNGNDPAELTPNNSYVPAIEAAIHAWDSGIDQLGQLWLENAFELDTYVLGRDDVPPDVMLTPDILVITDESEGFALGTAIRLSPCIVRMSKIELISFTYEDMFNVTLQEFGHCLGLRHVGSQGGVEPTSDLKHPEHDPMNGFYTHSVGFEGTHLHCISTLDVLALEYVFSYPSEGATVYMPTGAYGSTCETPRPDWRSLLPAGSTFAPGGEPQATPSPEPSEAPSPEPSEEPAPDPPTTEILSPQERSSIPSSRFKRVEGAVHFEGEGDPEVEVAIVKLKGDSCRWWDASEPALISGDCDSPIWNDVKGWAAWRLRVKTKSLPAGTYRALARSMIDDYVEPCCESGSNEVDFRLN